MNDLRKAVLVKGNSIIGAVGDKNFSTLHIGCITPYLGTKDNIPNGYLLADGASYKTTDYPDLFNIIGYTYGGSDDTFNIPNLCDGRFLEGSDTSGEYVEAGLPNIEGVFTATSNRDNTPQTFTGSFERNEYNASALTGSGGGWGNQTISFDASLSNPIYSASDTVQPKSLRVLYIIKAFHTNEGTDTGISDDVIGYIDDKLADCITTQGGIISGAISFKSAENGYCGITKHHDEDVDHGMLIQDTDKDENICAIKLSAANTNASIVCRHGDDVIEGELLHTGNINQHIGANIPKTNFEFTNTTNWSIPNSNLETCYLVRNGLCFLHIAAHCNIVANDNNSTVFVGLPNPVLQVYSSFAGVDCDPCQLTVTPNGSLFLRGGTAGKDYTFSFVYPVA